MLHNAQKSQTSPGHQRIRVGPRTQSACINCKERKLKCDDEIPSCANCQRYAMTCLVLDPATKRPKPRNYQQLLEERVASLERLLRQVRPNSSGPPIRNPSLNNDSGSSSKGSQHEEDVIVGQLASKVGMLDLHAAGAEPHYLGSSSVFAFSRMVNTSLRQIHTERPTSSFSLTEENANSLSPCLLPDYEVGIMFSNAYFENIHPQYPFLHEPTFRLWETQLLCPSDSDSAFEFDPLPLFFVNMVYSVGALLLPNSGSLPQLYINHVLALDKLESIQAILCCAMYSLRSPIGPSIWKLSGFALRQCIELGYHRSTRRFELKLDPLRLEIRKRVFWCAYSIDCAAAISLGRPSGIPQQEIDAEFPMDIDDSYITETGIIGSPRNSLDDPATSISSAIHGFRLRCIWARIHTSIYSDTTLISPSSPEYKSRIKQLRTEIENWLASAPPPLSRLGDALSIFATRDWYDLNYNHSILRLYRRQIIEGEDVLDTVFLDCLEAAKNVCRGYRRQYIGKPVKYTWGAVQYLFAAGLTYLHCLWTSSAARAAVRHDDMSKTCTDCTILLVMMATQWEGAAPYRDIFETFANRTITMMVDMSDNEVLSPSISPPSEGPDQQNLAQWITNVADVGMMDGIDGLLAGLVGDIAPQRNDGFSKSTP